ncbi:MAG: Aldehyde Dehydrogenase [Mycobacterium sp.]|nr:Aldehyde Dehydrogenase [Mycobacterium sp.]
MSTVTVTGGDLRGAAMGDLPPAAAFIDGEFRAGGGIEYVHRDPAAGQELRSWRLSGPDDVDDAVASALRAQRVWQNLDSGRRRDALLSLASAVEAHADTLAGLVSLEMGMQLRASKAGVHAAAEWFRHFAGYADKIEGSVPSVGAPGKGLDYTRYAPHGVVAAIIPWNGPVIALALKLSPALAAGNAVVLKPSELAPFSSLYFASLVVAAGLPAGLVNVVAGGPDVGARLCADPAVAMISFTGGSAGGRAVAEAAAARHVPTVLELGGKSASLVFPDTDVNRTAKLAAILGIAQNSGQGCFLPTRLLVDRSIYDTVLEGVIAAAAKFRLGDPFADDTTMGPVVDQRSLDRILDVISGARSRGDGRLVHGGGRATAAGLESGHFVEPTIFADVDPDSPLAQDEVFGPVLSVIPFDDEAQAVDIANRTRFGLAGYVWTADLGRAHRVADALQAGYVSVNGMAALPPGAPFGGWKASGYGVEGGRRGLEEYLRLKNVHVQW